MLAREWVTERVRTAGRADEVRAVREADCCPYLRDGLVHAYHPDLVRVADVVALVPISPCTRIVIRSTRGVR